MIRFVESLLSCRLQHICTFTILQSFANLVPETCECWLQFVASLFGMQSGRILEACNCSVVILRCWVVYTTCLRRRTFTKTSLLLNWDSLSKLSVDRLWLRWSRIVSLRHFRWQHCDYFPTSMQEWRLIKALNQYVNFSCLWPCSWCRRIFVT